MSPLAGGKHLVAKSPAKVKAENRGKKVPLHVHLIKVTVLQCQR